MKTPLPYAMYYDIVFSSNLTIRLIGVIMAVAGGGFMYMNVVLSDSSPSLSGSVLAGMGLFLAGAFLTATRSARRLSKSPPKLMDWWGLNIPGTSIGFPVSSKDRDLAGISGVTITRETRRSTRSSVDDLEHTYVVYPVTAHTTVDAVTLSEPTDYKQARLLAETVAKFFRIDLTDSSSGTSIVRKADRLDESVRDRYRRLGERPDGGSLPPDAASRVVTDGPQATAVIPPVGFSALHIAAVLLCLAAGGLAFAFGYQPFAVVLGILPLFLIVWNARRSFRILASPDGLVITRRSIFFLSKTRFSADELEEFFVHPMENETRTAASPKSQSASPAIAGWLGSVRLVARSDKKSVRIPIWPGKREADHIHRVLLSALIQ